MLETMAFSLTLKEWTRFGRTDGRVRDKRFGAGSVESETLRARQGSIVKNCDRLTNRIEAFLVEVIKIYLEEDLTAQ